MDEFIVKASTIDHQQASFTIDIPNNLKYCDGHFPHEPIVPGVAQLIPLAIDHAHKAWPELGHVREIKRLKFMVALHPKDTVELKLARVSNALPKQAHHDPKVRFEIWKGDERCSQGTLLFENKI